MLVAAFMPYVGFIIAFSVRKYALVKDRGLCQSGLKTKMLTLQSYVNLYSGPEVTIHFRYANIIN